MAVAGILAIFAFWYVLSRPPKARRDRARDALELEIQIRVIDGKVAADVARELAKKPMIAGIGFSRAEITELAKLATEELGKGRGNKFFRLDDKGVKAARDAHVAKLNRIRERAANGIYDPEP